MKKSKEDVKKQYDIYYQDFMEVFVKEYETKHEHDNLISKKIILQKLSEKWGINSINVYYRLRYLSDMEKILPDEVVIHGLKYYKKNMEV